MNQLTLKINWLNFQNFRKNYHPFQRNLWNKCEIRGKNQKKSTCNWFGLGNTMINYAAKISPDTILQVLRHQVRS
jgi:hypothetical protein